MKQKAKNYFVRLGLLISLNYLFFSLTNAANVKSPLLIVGFGLIMTAVYQLIYGLVAVTGLYGLRIKQKRLLTLYMTAATGLIIALQSMGGLIRRDIIVLLPLILVSYFYISYSKKASINDT